MFHAIHIPLADWYAEQVKETQDEGKNVSDIKVDMRIAATKPICLKTLKVDWTFSSVDLKNVELMMQSETQRVCVKLVESL